MGGLSSSVRCMKFVAASGVVALVGDNVYPPYAKVIHVD